MTLSSEQLGLLVEKAGGPAQVLRILSGEIEIDIRPARGALPGMLEVPVGIDFETRVARGGYGWRYDALTEARFPVTDAQIGAREQKLFHFNRSVSSEDAARLIREAGYEPARIGEILAFGEAAPEVQVRHPVVGLGSVAEIDGKASAPTLWFDGECRTLDLLWLDGDWHRNYRFLGVREA
ncbi:hypothetical protein P6144_11020 [Sphingomonas sp. HITSZ_GF]|uniref:hypothetical protein n=1 Tax=Sphingomonas sp. HITSZ_GF TaxID=3037247 RepID=UPI00240E205E|nr:hypothetical protein [Sphingomonas sp. HITSZ_GF]MDG2534182.1 hypothetical protein [Sphingomonas sp. HITSZ_GF]